MTIKEALGCLYVASTMAQMTKPDHMKCEEAKKVLEQALHALETKEEFKNAQKN